MTRELVWTGFVTADGFVDSPGGESEGHPLGGWVFRTPFDEAAYALKGEELADTSALLFGRRSYDAFAPFWPGSEDHAAYRDLPKFVVSGTLREEDLVEGWGPITILRSTEDVAELLRGDGGAVFIHGSAELARTLAGAGLIDRYNLLVFPTIIGSGKRAFPDTNREQRLRLRESASYANGVMKVIYDVVH